MRYFVTGATGFIGGRLAERLVADGHQVVALVRSPDKATRLTDLGMTIAQGDITDKDCLREPMAGADGIFHVAAWYKVGASDKSMAERINVGGTRNVLETMRELDIPKGVYTSTVAVYSDTGGEMVDESYRFDGEHISEYDRTKWLAHYEVAKPMMEAGLPLVIVMPGLVYGPGDHSDMANLVRDYLQGKVPSIPKETAFCWAHVDDIVEGHILAMDKGRPGEEYIITGPPHTMIEGFGLAEEVTGVPAPRLRLSPGLLKGMSGLSGLVERVVALPPTYSSESLRVVSGTTYLGDNSKAKQELGYSPRSLREGYPEVLYAMMDELGMQH